MNELLLIGLFILEYVWRDRLEQFQPPTTNHARPQQSTLETTRNQKATLNLLLFNLSF